MASIYDVKPNELITALASELEKKEEIKKPEWAKFVKTGVHKERPPSQENWWSIRAAAVLRSIRKNGPVGISKLRTKYGGKQNRGVKKHKFKKGSGKIIRTVVQQLEKANLIEKTKEKKGRKITSEGQRFLDNISNKLRVKK